MTQPVAGMKGIFSPAVPKTKVDPYGLSLALTGRPRPVHEFEVGPMFGIPSGKVLVRVATKREQDNAIVGAYRYVAERTKDAPESAKDPDILGDAKSAFIAHVVCRDALAPDEMPAFYAPEWMMENLTADQIAVLINFANEVRRKEGPAPEDISDETVEGIIALCAEHAGNDIPEACLANLGREYLTHLVVLISLKLQGARAVVPDAPVEVSAS